MTGETKLPMSQRRYRKSGGGVCPFCLSREIHGEEVVIDDGKAYQTVSCDDCEKSWCDEYQLTNYMEML